MLRKESYPHLDDCLKNHDISKYYFKQFYIYVLKFYAHFNFHIYVLKLHTLLIRLQQHINTLKNLTHYIYAANLHISIAILNTFTYM